MLQPLPVPSGKCEVWTLDFITDLPEVALGLARYNAILTIVDKFSKYCRLIPVYLGEGEMSAPQAAAIFYDHVV